MKKIFILLSCLALNLTAQTPAQEKPFIEVTGSSESEVVPDIIEITITLQEYVEGKSKMDIGKQEENLRTQLSDLGIESKQLTLVTAVADYQKIRMMKKDVVNSKTYLLRLSTAEMVGKVYERLDLIDVHYARVSRLDHTKILDLQRDNRIKAIKAAKEKADYLLSALGKTAGNPLQVLEGENWVENGPQGPRPPMMYKAYANERMEDASSEEPLSMRKIKIRNGYTVKFEIK